MHVSSSLRLYLSIRPGAPLRAPEIDRPSKIPFIIGCLTFCWLKCKEGGTKLSTGALAFRPASARKSSLNTIEEFTLNFCRRFLNRVNQRKSRARKRAHKSQVSAQITWLKAEVERMRNSGLNGSAAELDLAKQQWQQDLAGCGEDHSNFDAVKGLYVRTDAPVAAAVPGESGASSSSAPMRSSSEAMT